MNYIDSYQYTEIHEIELEIPKYCIRFLFIHLIVRKIGISCELVICFFFFRVNNHTLLYSFCKNLNTP